MIEDAYKNTKDVYEGIEKSGIATTDDLLKFASLVLAAIDTDDREAEAAIDYFCAVLGPLAKRVRAVLRDIEDEPEDIGGE